MSTTTVTPVTTGADLIREKNTVKGFIKEVVTTTKKPDGTEVSETSYKMNAKAETADGKNWEKMLKEGWAEWNENSVFRYTVKSMSAFQTLVPDETQQIYIIQAGLNYVQSTKQNAKAVEVKEGTGTAENPIPEPAFNQEEIDLREDINTPPDKKALSPYEKLERTLKGLGLDHDTMQALLLQAAQQFASKPTAQVEDEVEA